MDRAQALKVLSDTFSPQLVQQYLENTDETSIPDYWSHFLNAQALITDVRLFEQALAIRDEDAR